MAKQKHIIYFILIAAAVIALCLYNPWLLYFQNDDMVHIPLSRDGVLLQHNTFRPICDISIIIDYRFWGKQAWGYHLTNLVLHMVNSMLVFILCKALFLRYKLTREINLKAFTVAGLFWIYMNHSEAVFWILGRSAMLGMLFFLPAIFFYLKRRSSLNFMASLVLCVFAWLSYESTWILPGLLIFISLADIQTGYSKWRAERKYLFLVIIAFIIYFWSRFYFTGSLTGLYESGGMVNTDIFFLIGNLARLAIRSWLPPSHDERFLITGFIGLFLLITFLIVKTKNLKLKGTIIVLLLLWFISLLPYITLGMDTKGVESERFLYLPSFFICILITIIVFQLPFVSRIAVIIIICCTNILILTHHAKQYRFAGSVVKGTINAVNNLTNKNRLFAEGVPQENFGALIFRSGFNEGIQWLKNKGTIDSIIVLSESHVDLPLQKNYTIINSRDISLISDSTIRSQFTKNDVFLLFSDSSLNIIQ